MNYSWARLGAKVICIDEDWTCLFKNHLEEEGLEV